MRELAATRDAVAAEAAAVKREIAAARDAAAAENARIEDELYYLEREQNKMRKRVMPVRQQTTRRDRRSSAAGAMRSGGKFINY